MATSPVLVNVNHQWIEYPQSLIDHSFSTWEMEKKKSSHKNVPCWVDHDGLAGHKASLACHPSSLSLALPRSLSLGEERAAFY